MTRTLFVPMAFAALAACQSDAVPAPGASDGCKDGRWALEGGVVRDKNTGITWDRIGGTSSRGYSQAQAQQYCAALSLSPGGWRLPSAAELTTLIVPDQGTGCTIASCAFPLLTSCLIHWSNDDDPADSRRGMVVSFGDGVGIPWGARKGETYAVKCVR